MCLFYLRGVGGGDFRHASTFLPHLKRFLDCSPFTVCCFAFEKHGCRVVVTSFCNCSSRQQSTEVEKVIVFGCVCAWTTWRRPSDVVSAWAGVRHGTKTSFLRSVPDQGGSVSYV